MNGLLLLLILNVIGWVWCAYYLRNIWLLIKPKSYEKFCETYNDDNIGRIVCVGKCKDCHMVIGEYDSYICYNPLCTNEKHKEKFVNK